MQSIYTQTALVADALSLGPHWVYNQSKLKRLYPNGIDTYSPPISNYHPNKAAGDFTHYGDQTLLLYKVLAKSNAFSKEIWQKEWLDSMSQYKGYVDSATRETINNQGLQPSGSHDLAGAARLAPLLDLELDLRATITAAREQTSLTHGDPGVADAAEFYVRAIYAIKGGSTRADALEQASRQGEYTSLNVQAHLTQARLAQGKDILSAAADIGLTCHLTEAFPLSLFFALQTDLSLMECISLNGLAGGDTSARSLLFALLFTHENIQEIQALFSQLPHKETLLTNIESTSEMPTSPTLTVSAGSNSVSIPTEQGTLAGVLEVPEEQPKAYALFAHCFTCGKDFLPEKRITQRLAKQGIATLRIDFRGLGHSEGEFSETSFLTNIEDLISASQWLETHFQAPKLLIGHSLGGAAVLATAAFIPSTKAISTIGAPAEPAHVKHLFEAYIPEIMSQGSAEVLLAGRRFVIGKTFLDDLEGLEHLSQIRKLKGIDKLIMHAPGDTTVALRSAGEIYSALSHPKSFISLAGADHLLMQPGKAEYVADLISLWSSSALEIDSF